MARNPKRKSRYGGMSSDSGTNATVDRNYLEKPGHYIVRLNKVIEGETDAGAPYNVIEQTIMHDFADREPFTHPETGAASTSHNVGEDCGVFMDCTKKAFKANWKAFMENAAGVTEDALEAIAAENKTSVDQEWINHCEQVSSEDQPLAGQLVEVVVSMKRLRDARDKADDELKREDFWCCRTYKRIVSYGEFAEVATEAGRRLVPDLDERVALETAPPEEDGAD